MPDIDFASLLQNPLFLAGIQTALGDPRQAGQNFSNGLLQGGQIQGQKQQQALQALKLQQAQTAQSFDPTQYMKPAMPAQFSAPQMQQIVPAGIGGLSGAFTAPPVTADNAPAAIAGPGMQAPGAAPSPALMAAAQQPSIPAQAGGLDVQGLLSAGLKAGLGPGDIQGIAAMLDPQAASRAAVASKMAEPYNLSPGQTRNIGGQVIGRNDSLPPGGVPQQIQQLTALRDGFAPGSAQYQTYDAALNKISGGFDQQIQTQRQADLQNQRDFQNQQRQQSQEQMQGQREQSNDFKVQSQASQFANQLEKTGIPQADQTLNTIEGIMAKYPAGKLPGYGRVEGLLPNAALPQDAQTLRQAVAQLANINLKQRSGAAVTAQEYDRFKTELGNSTFVPEERLRQGITQMRALVEAQKKNAVGGVSDDALASYEANGGMPLSQLRPGKGSQTKAAAPAKIDPSAAQAELRRRGLIK